MASLSSDGADLPDDIANQMSLFYANPTPMLNTLSGAISKLLQEVQCVGVGVGVGVWVWVCMGGGGNVTRGAVWVNMLGGVP